MFETYKHWTPAKPRKGAWMKHTQPVTVVTLGVEGGGHDGLSSIREQEHVSCRLRPECLRSLSWKGFPSHR
ncbi:hypothetical protein KH5H1_70530 [Corallococcus caeni]|nr:hypothetical protein KH5H1_70530 [Corallococcus sp. KH5-1]